MSPPQESDSITLQLLGIVQRLETKLDDALGRIERDQEETRREITAVRERTSSLETQITYGERERRKLIDRSIPALDERLDSLEKQQVLAETVANHAERIGELEKWRAKMFGAGAIIGFVVSTVVTILLHTIGLI